MKSSLWYIGFGAGLLVGIKKGKKSGGQGGTDRWPLQLPDYKLHSEDPTNLYGCRLNPVTGLYAFHEGWDIQAPNGTELYAISDGVVTQSGDLGGWGNAITVDTGMGWSYMYAHRPYTDTTPEVGAVVKQGNIIGHIGTTGQTQGGHVHMEIRVNGEPVDPKDYMPVNENTCTVIPLPEPDTGCQEEL